jgi:hypothetical protein
MAPRLAPFSMQRSRSQTARRLYHNRRILFGTASHEFRFMEAAVFSDQTASRRLRIAKQIEHRAS